MWMLNQVKFGLRSSRPNKPKEPFFPTKSVRRENVIITPLLLFFFPQEDTISINHNWVNAWGVLKMWEHVQSELVKVSKAQFKRRISPLLNQMSGNNRFSSLKLRSRPDHTHLNVSENGDFFSVLAFRPHVNSVFAHQKCRFS